MSRSAQNAMDMPRSYPDLGLDALAVARLTKLLTDDELLAEPRDWLVDKAFSLKPKILGRKVAYFVTCPWCMSVWLGFGVVILRRRARWWGPVAEALAFSAVAGLAAHVVEL